MIVYALALGIARLLSVLPLSAALAVGRGLGAFAFHVARVRRAVVLHNLRYTLGAERSEAQLRRIAAGAYRQMGMTLVEVLRASCGRSEELCGNVTYDPLEPFEALRARGAPVVIMQPHIGNFDLAAYAFATRGFPLHTVMIRIANRRLNELVVRTREAHDITVHVKGAETTEALRKALARGEWLGVLPDQRPRHGKGARVEILGRPVRIFPGPALLHLETGAALCLAADVRQRDDPRRHHVGFSFLELPPPTGDREADVQAIMQKVADAISDAIRRNPDQYFWFHRLFGKDVAAGKHRAT